MGSPIFMRLSLTKAAHAAVGWIGVQEIRVKPVVGLSGIICCQVRVNRQGYSVPGGFNAYPLKLRAHPPLTAVWSSGVFSNSGFWCNYGASANHRADGRT